MRRAGAMQTAAIIAIGRVFDRGSPHNIDKVMSLNRDLRHKVYAHRVVGEDQEVEPIVAKTNVREVEHLLLFLLRFYESMWHLFMSGRKPTLRRLRCMVDRAGRLSLPRRSARERFIAKWSLRRRMC